MRTRVLLGAAAATLIATASLASPLDEGVQAAKSGDYQTALTLLTPLAEAGEPQAEFTLGVLYANGYGVAKDPAVAARWYRRAADKGLAEAQNNLGALYSNGEGVPHDHA